MGGSYRMVVIVPARGHLETGTKYRGLAAPKGVRYPAVLHMFLFCWVVSLCVECTS